jgi:hypothetical protein
MVNGIGRDVNSFMMGAWANRSWKNEMANYYLSLLIKATHFFIATQINSGGA